MPWTRCPSCGFQAALALRLCPECGQVLPGPGVHLGVGAVAKNPGGRSLAGPAVIVRGLPSGLMAFDAIGEGRIPFGAVILLAGGAGAGKSTAALLLAKGLADRGAEIVYLAFEEGLEPIRRRAQLVGALHNGISVWQEWPFFGLQRVPIEDFRPSPVLWIVDSLQRAPMGGHRPLTPSHAVAVAERGRQIVEVVTNRTVLILCHVDKDGNAAGPNEVAHLVDVVLYVERADEKDDFSDRVIRIEKNRFGPCSESLLPWPFKERRPA